MKLIGCMNREVHLEPGVGIVNPVFVIPLEGEFREKLEANAAKAGMSFEDYLDKMIDEANAEADLTRE